MRIDSTIHRALAKVTASSLLGLLVCAFLASCGRTEGATSDIPISNSTSSISATWADSVLATMDDVAMAKQMVICQSLDDSIQVKDWHDPSRNEFGGVLLPSVPFKNLPDLKGLRDSTPIPAWIALDMDSTWTRLNDMPCMLRIGAIQERKTVWAWAKGLGEVLQAAGANMILMSAGKIILEESIDEDGLGSDPARVFWQSQAIAEGIRSSAIMPVFRPLPSAERQVFRGGKGQLLAQLIPFQLLSRGDSLSGQLTLLHAPAIDKSGSPHSKAITSLLRQSDSQVLFSPVLRGQNGEIVASSALKCLQSGQDVVVVERFAHQVVESIIRAIHDGELPKQIVQQKVRRILAAKHAQRQWKRNTDDPSIPPAEKLTALSAWIRESSITILRDNHKLLPLQGGISNLEIGILLPGNSQFPDLTAELSVYGSVKHFNWDTTKAGAETLRKNLVEVDLVVVPFATGHGQNRNGKHAATEYHAHLKTLPTSKVCVVNFGPAYELSGLESMDLVIQAWQNGETEQRAVARLLVGGLGSVASIPLQCGPLFCTGDGIRRQGAMRLAYTLPEMAGATSGILHKIDRILEEAIQEGAFPGCQVLAAKDGRVFLHKAYGHHDYARSKPVKLNDLYDLASVTKIAATTLMAMRLYESDTAFKLDKPLKAFLPELDSSFITIKDITPRELLTHRAGLPAGLPIYRTCVLNDSAPEVRARAYADKADTLHQVCVTPNLYLNGQYLDSLWLLVRRTPLDSVKEFRYSDMSMFLLQRVLERVAHCSLDRFMDSVFYQPMGLLTLGYLPVNRFPLDRITPTENDRWWRNQLVHGSVHDPSAAMFGGVGGQAGLFSNAWDLAALMHLLLNNGNYAGYSFLQPQTIRFFTSRQPGCHRGLGFDMQRSQPIPGEGMVAWAAHPNTFGHLGFTGTCAWADPENQIIFIFLSNRVYPDAQNKRINQMRIRQRVQDVVYESLGLIPPPEQMGCYLE